MAPYIRRYVSMVNLEENIQASDPASQGDQIMDIENRSREPEIRKKRKKRKPPYGLYVTICLMGIALLLLGTAFLSELAANGHLPAFLEKELFVIGPAPGQEAAQMEDSGAESEKAVPENAYEAYASFLQMVHAEGEDPDLRYQYAYIDADDRPELVMASGRRGSDGVTLYTTRDDLSVVKIGTFSQYGILYYIPHENICISQCGEKGTYYTVYHSLRGTSAILERILMQTPGDEDTLYYCGFSWADDFTGDSACFQGDPVLSGLHTSDKRETEAEEYFRLQEMYENGHDRQLIAYEDMIPLSSD